MIFLFLFFQNAASADGKLKVAASFYPLAHFAEQVGGEYAEVFNIMPPGAEPHEFEPTPGDIAKVYSAGVFLFHGAGLDPWADGIRADLKNKGTLMVMMTDHFDLAGTGEDDQKDHGGRDPHIWLDPVLAGKMVEIIRDAFIKADPTHEETFRKNSAGYAEELAALHEKFASGLKSCAKRDIIVTHAAFNYMTGRYHLTAHSITGISPEEEPSARKVAELARLALKKGIKYIFFEQLVSPKMAETIANEVGAKTLVLNPLGGLTEEDIRKGRTYISVMEENLRNLRVALGCD